MNLSLETLQFFEDLLGQVSLPANTPDFEEKAALLSRVRRELAKAIAAESDKQSQKKD